MKTLRFLFLLTLVLTLSSTNAQKTKTYKIWVSLVDKEEVKGILYDANEDELVIVADDFNQLKFAPENIGVIKLRRQGKVGRGAWIGALSGMAIGFGIGYASESDADWQGAVALGSAILAAPAGSLMGMAIGSAKEKFVINGDRDLYISLLPKLKMYTVPGADE